MNFRSKKTIEDNTLLLLDAIFHTMDAVELKEPYLDHRRIVIAVDPKGAKADLHWTTLRTLHRYTWLPVEGSRWCYIENGDRNGKSMYRVFIEISDVFGILKDGGRSSKFQDVSLDGLETTSRGNVQEDGPNGYVPFDLWPRRFQPGTNSGARI